MRRLLMTVIAAASTLGTTSGGQAGVAADSIGIQTAFLVDAQPDCGLQCAAYLLRLYGLKDQAQDIRKLMTLTSDGVSLLQIRDCLQRFKMRTQPLHLSYSEYLDMNRPAVAHVDGNHFVVFEKVIGSKIKVIDPPSLPVMVGAEDLKGHWRGDVLILEDEPPNTEGDPEIISERSLLDAGQIEKNGIVQRSFRVSNTGKASLRIQQIVASCHCTSAAIDVDKIEPNASATLTVAFNSLGKSAAFSQDVYIQSDDPLNPISRFRVKGAIKSAVVVDPPYLAIEPVVKGAVIEKHFRVGLPAGQSIEGASSSSPAIQVEVNRVDGSDHVKVTVDEKMPVGKFQGEVVIKTSVPGERSVTLPIFGEILGCFKTEPAALFLGILNQADTRGGTVEITSRDKQAFRIKSVRTDVKGLTFLPEADRNGNILGHRHRITFQVRAMGDGRLIEGSVFATLECQDGSDAEISVPLVAVRE